MSFYSLQTIKLDLLCLGDKGEAILVDNKMSLLVKLLKKNVS